MTGVDHQQLETCERDAWADLFSAAPDSFQEQYGLVSHRLGGGLLTIAAGLDVLAFNRTFALGMSEDATERVLDEAIERYRQHRVSRFFFQVAPGSSPRQLTHWILRRGFTHYNNWVKLFRRVADPVQAETDLRVAVIDPEQAPAFGTIAAQCFDWPGQCARWIASTVGRRGWTHWMAFDRERPVATASLFVKGEYAWPSLASTLPEARGRGAQSALMAARIAAAKRLGCRQLVVETAEETPQKQVPSFRNLRRLGFQVAYVRANYLYRHA